MPDVIRDLWPSDVATDVVTPVAILRFQGAQLRKKTKNLLEADVVTEADSGWVVHHFDLVAPALDNYRYRLFSVRHKERIVYPAHIEGTTGAALPPSPTQSKFMDVLGEVLQSNEAKSVIHSLIAESNEVRGDSPERTEPQQA